MSFWRRLPSVLWLGFASLAVSGCPMTLEDDFHLKATAGASSEAGAGGSIPDETAGAPNGGDDGREPRAGQSAGGTNSAGSSGGQLTGQAGEGGAGGETSVGGCPPSETDCSGTCVDLSSDDENCGKCGDECLGTTCHNGSCTNDCVFGRADCNRNLIDGCEIDPSTDPKNCGNCDIGCGFQMACVAGECVCPAGTADCNGDAKDGCETDTSSDSGSCGACGAACNLHETCASGSCECAPGFADCNGSATDGCEASLNSAATCGSCTFDCGPHSSCVADGQCGCLDGYLDCDGNAAGCETTLTDPLHCGKCDVACDAAAPVCDGTACSTGCGSLTKCGDSCVDLQQDPQNCGTCGKQVGAHQLCVDGKPECVSGYGDCDGNANDCEVDLDNDAAHCGDCGTSCKPGALCTAGGCDCAPGTPNDCGSSCEKCCNDAQCSDGNSCTTDSCSAGVCSSGSECASGSGLCCAKTGCFECCGDADCTGGKICTGNKCVTLTCTLPLIACDTKCVDPRSDAANCAGCGNACGVGRSCSTSSCTPKWAPVATAPAGFVARQKSAYTALGSKVFVWGGVDANGTNLADGAIYDAASDSWTSVAASGSPPSARVLASAVWTGSVVVVWGGGNAAGTQDYTSGGRYDPSAGTWLPMSTVGAPTGTRAAHAFWTGSRVLVYGGYDAAGAPSADLSLYDPVNDKWSSTSQNNRPAARINVAAGWTGSQLVVYGGQVPSAAHTRETRVYDPGSNVWAKRDDGPTSRAGTFAAWDGALFFVWGGSSGALRDDGQVYAPGTDDWTDVSSSGEPSSRWAPQRQAGWSVRIKPGLTLLLGGIGQFNTARTDGALYNSTSQTWTAVPAWPSGVSHQWGVGVWTGSEFVLWSGLSGTGSTLTAVGERYLP